MEKGLQNKMIRKFRPAILLLGVLILGGLFTWWAVQRADNEMRKNLLRQARLVAQSIDLESIKAFPPTRTDLNRPCFRRLREHLASIKQICNKYRFVSLMICGDDRKESLLVESGPVESAGAFLPEDVREKAKTRISRLLQTDRTALKGPETIRGNAGIFALVPLSVPQSDKLPAILIMSIDADHGRWALLRAGLPPVLITLALVVLLLAGWRLLIRRSRMNDAAPRWMRYLEPALAAAVGLVITLAAAWMAHKVERRAYQAAFAQLAATRTATVSEKLHDICNYELTGMARFYAGSKKVTRKEFRQYTAHLTKNPAVLAWAWTKAVPAAARNRFVAAARASGLENFEIWQRDAAGQRTPATGRDFYYPVWQVAPFSGNKNLLGYDLGSVSSCRAALEKAKRTDLPTATPPLESSPETSLQKTMLFCRPVLSPEPSQSPPGFVLALVLPEDLLENAAQNPSTQIALSLVDGQETTELLATNGKAGSFTAAGFSLIRPVNAFGKNFVISARPGKEFLRLHPARAGWFIALAGLFLTAALSFLINLGIRRRAELERLVAERTKSLSESEENFRTLFESMTDIMVVAAPGGRILFTNQAVADKLGYTKEELAAMHLEDWYPPDQRTENKRLADAILQGERDSCRLPLTTKDGSLVPVDMRLWYGRWSGDDCLFGICKDLSAEEEAQQQVALLGRMLDDAPAAVMIHDTAGRIHFVNQRATEMHGYDEKNELLAKNLRDLDVPESRALIDVRMRQIEDKGEASFEVAHYRKDGSTFPLEAIVKTIEWDGRPAVLSIATDITERKQAEMERARLMSAVEQANEAFVITDTEATIEYVNPAFEKITGYSRGEVIGETPRILKSGEQDETFYRDMWQTLTSGQTWSGRIINRRKDGSHYTEETAISPVFDASGKIIHYVSVKRDISEHLRISEMLQQSQKMESVGRLAGGVAHDFNNMLNVILGHTELALSQLAEDNPLRDRFLEIQKAARRSADLTGQLLAFARKQTAAPRVLDLNKTVATMLKMLRRLIGEDIELEWKPAEALDPVCLDPSQVDQILANLCVNARDAIKGPGRLTLETDKAVFNEADCGEETEAAPGEYVLLAVSDNGCGMDKEILANIFDPFFTTKNTGEGTGLGLATVYGIVKQNYGFIHVYSEPGRGTTFRIYLPRYQGRAAQSDEKTATATPGGSETILLVEDEAPVLKMTTLMLEQYGYTVLAASTPGEALQLARQNAGEIQLLLTDVVMPEMNGRELAQNIQMLSPDLKCLFISGYTANVIADQGILDEEVHFIQKPFTMRGLNKKVREALDSPGD